MCTDATAAQQHGQGAGLALLGAAVGIPPRTARGEGEEANSKARAPTKPQGAQVFGYGEQKKGKPDVTQTPGHGHWCRIFLMRIFLWLVCSESTCSILRAKPTACAPPPVAKSAAPRRCGVAAGEESQTFAYTPLERPSTTVGLPSAWRRRAYCSRRPPSPDSARQCAVTSTANGSAETRSIELKFPTRCFQCALTRWLGRAKGVGQGQHGREERSDSSTSRRGRS